VNDHVKAAEAYELAAKNAEYYTYDYCYAARSQFLREPTNQDAVLADGKLCIDEAAKNTNKSRDHYFNDAVPSVYSHMAQVLIERGVYQAALDYLKEALQMEPSNSYAMGLKADVYYYQQRFSECESASTEAIRLSDGKYPYMQFRLGTCYFSQSNWAMAVNSFRIAANADKTDPSAAFNLALALSRENMDSDSQVWFREALRRNPDAELRAKILNGLK
jgi:tetratricopeptide (TPR) repeat protein